MPTWGLPLYAIRINKDPRENILEAFCVSNKIQPGFQAVVFKLCSAEPWMPPWGVREGRGAGPRAASHSAFHQPPPPAPRLEQTCFISWVSENICA